MPSSALPPLSHPWGDALPATGERLTLLPGLHWVRMPLPFALNHINLWVLDDEQDKQATWTVVDTGVATPEIQAAWQALFNAPQAPFAGPRLGRVIATHMHPDHVGNAHWLISQFSDPHRPARLWMSAADYLAAQIACHSTTGYGGARAADYFTRHGLDDPEGMRKVRERGGYYASMVPQVPEQYRRLQDGLMLQAGSREWRCIAGFGHSPEHISLYSERDGVLIAGDMLLPRISTNVSVTDTEPEADALGQFLASLQALKALPVDTLALPSHGLPFKGIHTRIAQLESHHEARLEEVMQACQDGPKTAAQMLPVLFKRSLDLHQTTFAMGEAVAHLNHLWHRGALRREQDAQGIWRFATA